MVVVAVKITLLPPHTEVCAVAIDIVGVAVAITVIVFPADVTFAGVAQIALLVKIQLTTLPVAKVVVVNVLIEVMLTAVPFILQVNCGEVPALVVLAAKVIGKPEHTVNVGVVILMVGVTGVFTVIKIAADL